MGGGLRFVDEKSVRKNMRLSISRRIFYVVICWIKNMTYTNGSDELFHDLPHTLPGRGWGDRRQYWTTCCFLCGIKKLLFSRRMELSKQYHIKLLKDMGHENKSMPSAVKALSRSDIITHRALPLENCFLKGRMLTFSVFIQFFCASTAYQRMIST